MATSRESELVAAVLGPLIQSVGRGEGAELADIQPELRRVWQELARIPGGAEAVRRAAAAPEDGLVQAEAAVVVTELLRSNGELGDALAAFRPAGGSAAARKRRFGAGAVMAAVLALASLAAGLSVYLGDQPAVLTFAQAKAALPDLGALPAGWRTAAEAEVGPPLRECVTGESPDICEHVRSVATVAFTSRDGVVVVFMLITMEDRTWGEKAYRRSEAAAKAATGANKQMVPVPAMGDASVAVGDSSSMDIGVEVGTEFLSITSDIGNSGGSWDKSTMLSLARMFVARVQQAEQGRTPDASVR
ncbi:hypothetical protein ACIHEI_33100 [Kitasatospora sp. NPDC051984]|uniref:hypothetical protein n=1 Tax=Kitasatospora sp. NPDC051984 TaxID=3364059 RepID=UPI0037C6E7B3